MATFNQKDVQSLFVGGAATKSTGGIDALNLGEIGIFTPGGTRVTEASAADVEEFMIVQDRGDNPPLVSGVIKKSSLLTKSKRKAYVAATNKVDYIGFDGVGGAITVANEVEYHVRLSLTQSKTSNHGGLYMKHGFYKSDLSATQAEIAAGLHLSLANEFKREADKQIVTERVNNDAGAALGTAVGPVNFVNGSKYVSAADVDDSTINAALLVGGYIRVGTTLTDPCYKIVAIDTTSNVLTLDVPFQGPTATIADTALQSITAVAEATSDWGLKLVGQELKFVVGKLHYGKVDWDLSLENFGSTPINHAVYPSIGSGDERYMKELEWFCQGNEGDFYRMGEPNIIDSRSDVSGNYSLIDLVSREVYTGSIVAGPIHKQYTLAVPSTTPNYALDATANDITDVLEVLVFGAAGGEFDLG